MIQIRRAGERGFADHGWLKTQYTFSFADYFDPDFMGFSALRVINQDEIAAGKGFPMHGHRDMEIVTYVLDGVLEHRDSMGTGSQIRPGEVQLMSAGTGVTHSEFNAGEGGLWLLQMWVLPRTARTHPRYEQKEFPRSGRRGRFQLLVSPRGEDGSLTIGQEARLLAALVDGDEVATQELAPGRAAWLHVARGHVRLNGATLEPGDGAAIQGEQRLTLDQGKDAEVVLWDLPSP